MNAKAFWRKTVRNIMHEDGEFNQQEIKCHKKRKGMVLTREEMDKAYYKFLQH